MIVIASTLDDPEEVTAAAEKPPGYYHGFNMGQKVMYRGDEYPRYTGKAAEVSGKSVKRIQIKFPSGKVFLVDPAGVKRFRTPVALKPVAQPKASAKPVVKRKAAPEVKAPARPVKRAITIGAEDLKTLVTALATMAYFAHPGAANISNNDLPRTRELVEPAYNVLNMLGIDSQMLSEPYREVTNTGVLERNKDLYLTMLKGIQALQKDFAQTSSLSPVLLEMLNYSRLAANGSDNGMKLLEKSISLLKNPTLLGLVSKTNYGNTQEQDIPTLREMVKKLGGTGLALTVAQKKKYSTIRNTGKAVPDYDEYLSLRLGLANRAKLFVRDWVRQNGDKDGLADYETAIKALDAAKFLVHNYVSDFVGKIDDQSRLYTVQGRLINGSPQGGKVMMNPNYDGENDVGYVFRAQPPGALTIQPYYTLHHKGRGNAKKFAIVKDMSASLPEMRKKWRAVLKAGGRDEHNPEFLAAMCLEIVYQTQARIGSESGATMVNGVYQKTYGLTVLRCKHMRVLKGGISFTYQGKTNGKQNHKMYAIDGAPVRKVIELLTAWKADRKPDEPLFMTRRGNSLSSTEVNHLLRKIGAPAGCTIKKFRTLRGTAIFSELAKSFPYKTPTDATKVTNWMKNEAMAVGKQLGHHSGGKLTSATAIQNYIDVSVMLDLYKQASAIPPKQMLKLVGVDPNALEGYEG